MKLQAATVLKVMSVAVGAMLVSACNGNLRSYPLRALQDTTPKFDGPYELKQPRSGKVPVFRYYLPDPWIQLTVYETRSLGQPRLQPVLRSVAVPDMDHPLLLENNYAGWAEHSLKVSLTPEGFLERIQYNRKPKAVDAVGTVARAVMQAVAPVPLPFKGDPDFPEFSRVVYQRSFLLSDLVSNLDYTKDIPIAGKFYSLSAKLPSSYRTSASSANRAFMAFPGAASADGALHQTPVHGFYHRPIIPVEVTLEEVVFGPVTPKLTLKEILYCPDPQQLDIHYFPFAIFAAQDLDLRFSAGTLYQVEGTRESDVMALVNGIVGIPSATVNGVVSGIFTVNVHHRDGKSGDGGKGSSSGQPQRPKE